MPDVKRILMVDDDRGTKAEAFLVLRDRGYEFVDLAVERTNAITYWQQQNITPADLICLDLKFIGYDKFTGHDVFVKLQEGKQRGLLPGLEQVLIQTHLRTEVDPKQTSMYFFTASEFKVYGYQKAEKPTSSRERVVDPVPYALGLADAIDEIYQGRGQGLQLNKKFYSGT